MEGALGAGRNGGITMNAAATEQLGEIVEQFIRTEQDKAGRVFGYIVGLREVLSTGECYAWVQRAVEIKHDFKDFGPRQRSKKFPSVAAARAWGFATAKARAAERRKN